MEKVIHYCWFGGNPLPELAEKCIASWKKYCPDYQIKEWNEQNFDMAACDYIREAVEQKKWAFASDYARFKILYEEGGLYFDTDVELIASIDDIVAAGPFMAFEKRLEKDLVAAGLGLGAEKGMPFYKTVLASYESSHFSQNGQMNLYSVVDRITDLLKQEGLGDSVDFQTVAGINLYPSDYFCPLCFDNNQLTLTENSRAIHWYDASWLSPRMKVRQKRTAAIRRAFPGKAGQLISKLYTKCSYLWEWTVTGTLLSKAKNKLGGK